VETVLRGQQDFRQTIVEAIEEKEIQIVSATQEFQHLKTQMNHFETVVKEYEKRFGIIFPILRDFKKGSSISTPSTNPPLITLPCKNI